MSHMKRLWVGAAVATSLLFVVQAHADTTSAGVKIGVLTCNVSSGWGLVFGSSKNLNCTFSPTPDRAEKYVGKIDKYGVDIGYQKAGVLVWAVFAPTSSLTPGALTGHYGGATAGASALVGASANALVGGSDSHIALQPVSIEGATGLNVAAGVAQMSLQWAP